MKTLISLFIFLSSLQTLAASLELNIQKLKNLSGALSVTLYNSQEAFPHEDKAFQKEYIALTKFKKTIQFTNLPPGKYAVVVYHDENENKKLDSNAFHIPEEGYGLSLNPKIFGPPQFTKSAFELTEKESKSLDIEIKYSLF